MPFAIQALTPANKNINIPFKAYYQIVSTARNILCSIPPAAGYTYPNVGEILPKVDEVVILPQQVSVYAATPVSTPTPPIPLSPPTLVSTAPFYSQILQASPYLYWRLGESTGTTAYDCTGNGNIGVYQGSYALSRATSVGGDANRSVLLADATAKITSQVAEQAIDKLSIFLRFKVRPSSDILGMFYLGDTITQPASYILSVLVSPKGILYLYTNDGNIYPTNCWINSFGSVKDTQWHTLTITISNGFKKIYQDGFLKLRAPISTTFNTKNLYWTLGTGAWLTGNNNYASYLGLLDEFALFNTELSPDQIYSIHQSAIASPLLTVTANAVNLTYASDGDSNGLFYYLGSKGRTTAWSNPASNNLVAISTANSTSTSVTALVDRTGDDLYVQTVSPNFVTFNISNSGYSLIPQTYSIRTRPYDANHLRNWILRGSNDGKSWDNLDIQINNKTLSYVGQWLTIVLLGITQAYTYFQIYMNGVDSGGAYYLCLSEFELYGIIAPIDTISFSASIPVTLNHNDTGSAISLSSDGLTVAYSGGKYCLSRANISKQKHKWYWEVSLTGSSDLIIGVATDNASCRYIGFDAFGWGYYSKDGTKSNQAFSSYATACNDGDVIGVALDLDKKTVEFYKNGISQTIAFSNVSGSVFPAISGDESTLASASATANFGDSPFVYPMPTRFQAYNQSYSLYLEANQIILSYVSDGDANGVFYYLGSNRKKQAWSNPYTFGVINIVLSQNPSSGNVSQLVDRQAAGDFYIGQSANISVTFDLGVNYSLSLKKYSIRNRHGYSSDYLRNFKIRGSNDNVTWIDLDTQVNNTTFISLDQWLSIDLPDYTISYRYLQLYTTGIDSSGAYYLCIDEVEFYGILTILAPDTDPSPSFYPNAVLADNPIAYWRLGEKSGTVAADTSGNGNTGTYSGGVTLGVPGSLTNDPSTAVTFDGATGYVLTTTSYSGPQVFTLEARFKTTATNTGLLGFSSDRDTNLSSYDRRIYLDSTGHIRYMTYTGYINEVVSPLTYNDGRWHSVDVTMSSAGSTIYVDGNLVINNAGMTSAQGYTGYWHIGFAPGQGYFNGTLQEIAIYGASLSAARIQAHYQFAITAGTATSIQFTNFRFS